MGSILEQEINLSLMPFSSLQWVVNPSYQLQLPRISSHWKPPLMARYAREPLFLSPNVKTSPASTFWILLFFTFLFPTPAENSAPVITILAGARNFNLGPI